MFIQHPNNTQKYINISLVRSFTIRANAEPKSYFDNERFLYLLNRYRRGLIDVKPNESEHTKTLAPYFRIVLHYSDPSNEELNFNSQQDLDEFLSQLVPTKATL